MRQVEAVDRDNTGMAVTVTPTRITLKCGTDITTTDVHRVLDAVEEWVPSVSYRGFYKHGTHTLRLRNSNKTHAVRLEI